MLHKRLREAALFWRTTDDTGTQRKRAGPWSRPTLAGALQGIKLDVREAESRPLARPKEMPGGNGGVSGG